jgi:hypothetical protein
MSSHDGASRYTDASELRLVEIGAVPFIKACFPEQTTFFSTFVGAQPERILDRGYRVSLRGLAQVWRAVHQPGVALIVCHPTSFAPWHWKWLTRIIFHRRILQGHISPAPWFAPQMLRGRMSAPLAIMDMDDIPIIHRSRLFLLDRCQTYFKRELPADRWRLFLRTAHPDLPTPRFRRQKRFAERLIKLRPISLGLPHDRVHLLPIQSTEKTTDIFFSGRLADSSTVRSRGFSELLALRDRGLIVDVADNSLAPLEFYARCARARLVWSPEGLGWDCFRHYEALACNAVPIINNPPIERYRPLMPGEHAFYYDVEPGGLTRTVLFALSDKSRLLRMGEAGRQYVLAHHTPVAIARYIVQTTLGRALPT